MAACTATPSGTRAVDLLQPRSLLSLHGVNHISKVCSNVAASVAFYRDILGFIVVKRPQQFDDTFEGCWLWRYGLGLHLIKGTPVARPAAIDPKSDHLSFVGVVDEVHAALASRGIPCVRQEVHEGGQLVTQLFFHDPDRNMIEVCNCDCLPIIPLADELGCCQACQRQHVGGEACEDEAMSALSTRDSMDSVRSGAPLPLAPSGSGF